jgi:hypothetical protein
MSRPLLALILAAATTAACGRPAPKAPDDPPPAADAGPPDEPDPADAGVDPEPPPDEPAGG